MRPRFKNGIIKDLIANFAPAGVLVWALSVLTASYFGYASNVDAAFISSLVTTVLASYGITRVQKDDKKEPPSQRDHSKDDDY
tara:strand:- start:1502 stop:1750 length:249 start_codon:yes stop_codon:yes gene_type:complete